MAAVRSNIMEVQLGNIHGRFLPSDMGGRVRIAHGELTTPEKPGNQCELLLALLPRWARVLPSSFLHLEDGFKGVSVKVGDFWKSDRYFPLAGIGEKTTLILDGNKLSNFIFPEEGLFSAVLTGNIPAGKKIIFDIQYVVD